jgi:hypothetical protein
MNTNAHGFRFAGERVSFMAECLSESIYARLWSYCPLDYHRPSQAPGECP